VTTCHVRKNTHYFLQNQLLGRDLLALRAASADRSINDLAVEAIEKQLSTG
jgi:hypothetical protein